MELRYIDTESIKRLQRKLLNKKRYYKTWRNLAARLKINVSYLYNFCKYGDVPRKRLIRKRLGFTNTRTLDEISKGMRLPINEMPEDSLLAAFIFREDM